MLFKDEEQVKACGNSGDVEEEDQQQLSEGKQPVKSDQVNDCLNSFYLFIFCI